MKNQKCENSYHYLSMFQRTNFFLSKYTSKVELYVSSTNLAQATHFKHTFLNCKQLECTYRKKGTSRQKQRAFHWREKGVVMEKGGGEIFTAHC